MCDLSKKYIMKISGKTIYKTIYANTIEELLNEISSLGLDVETKKDEFIKWLEKSYPTCKIFLPEYSVEWCGNFRN